MTSIALVSSRDGSFLCTFDPDDQTLVSKCCFEPCTRLQLQFRVTTP